MIATVLWAKAASRRTIFAVGAQGVHDLGGSSLNLRLQLLTLQWDGAVLTGRRHVLERSGQALHTHIMPGILCPHRLRSCLQSRHRMNSSARSIIAWAASASCGSWSKLKLREGGLWLVTWWWKHLHAHVGRNLCSWLVVCTVEERLQCLDVRETQKVRVARTSIWRSEEMEAESGSAESLYARGLHVDANAHRRTNTCNDETEGSSGVR